MKYEYTSTGGNQTPSGFGWTLLHRHETESSECPVLFWSRQDPTEKLEEEAIAQEAKRLRTALVQISSMCGGPEEVSDEALLLVPGEVSAVMREHRKEMECMAKVADNAMRMERERARRVIDDLQDQNKALKHQVNVMGQEIEDFRKIAGAPDHETAMKVLGGAGGRLNGLFMHVNELEEKLRSVQEQRNDRYLEICSILDASDESWPSLFAKIRALKEREAELEADFAAFVTCSVAGELPPAPDGASDIRRGAYNAVRGLRKRLDEVALERDRTEKERNALRARVAELEGANAETLRLNDWLKNMAMSIDSGIRYSGYTGTETLKAYIKYLKGIIEFAGVPTKMLTLDNGRTVTCGKCGNTALQVCTHLADNMTLYSELQDKLAAACAVAGAVDSSVLVEQIEALKSERDARVSTKEVECMLAEHRSLKARVTELESRPLSPEVARVVEAVATFVGVTWDDEKSDPPAEFWKACDGVLDAYRALPSPLPTVVTCGGCEHCGQKEFFDYVSPHCSEWDCETCAGGYCHLGKRRQS